MAVVWKLRIEPDDVEHLSEDELSKFVWHLEETCRAILAHWAVEVVDEYYGEAE